MDFNIIKKIVEEENKIWIDIEVNKDNEERCYSFELRVISHNDFLEVAIKNYHDNVLASIETLNKQIKNWRGIKLKDFTSQKVKDVLPDDEIPFSFEALETFLSLHPDVSTVLFVKAKQTIEEKREEELKKKQS